MYLKCLNLIKKHLQFIKFSLVGVSNTLVGMVNSFILNMLWVFKSNKPIGSTAVKFALINLCALSTSTFLLYLCGNIVGLNKILAQIVVTILVLIISFSANKIWAFKTS